jgi:hypothetical protein
MMSRTAKAFVAALALAGASLAPIASANAAVPPGATGASGGRQMEAPPWSFACMTDHGPSRCGEPMWVYGN